MGSPLGTLKAPQSLSLASPAATIPIALQWLVPAMEAAPTPRRDPLTRGAEASGGREPTKSPHKIDQPFPHTQSVLDLVRPRLGESPLAQPRRSPPVFKPSLIRKSFPVPPRPGPYPASSSLPSKPHCPRHAWSLKGPKGLHPPSERYQSTTGASARPAGPHYATVAWWHDARPCPWSPRPSPNHLPY